MNKPRLLMTCPALPGILEQLLPHFEVQVSHDEVSLNEAQLIEKLRGMDAVFTAMNARYTRNVLQQAPELKIISAMTVGYDNIDVATCTAMGIVVSNAPEVLNQTTADFAWALLLATARRVTEAEQWLRAGHWQRWQLTGFLGADVYGKTLGILGMGNIGQAIARRSMGFDMQVMYHNRSRLSPDQEAYANSAQFVSKEELLEKSDHLILMLPYSAATHHAMGAEQFARMKPGAILINTARGGVVDDAALILALRSGQIAGAGLDVFENEPRLNPEWLTLPNVVLTPHIASASAPTRLAMQQCAVNNLIQFIQRGTVINSVK